ncbi:hypothetical protein NUM3379_37970 [Kineococcus sp. NUM-3379]
MKSLTRAVVTVVGTTGLVLAGALPAQAAGTVDTGPAERGKRIERPVVVASGGVGSSLRTVADTSGAQRFVVDHTLGTWGGQTYVHSALTGRVTIACFRDGAPVAGTVTSLGERTVGTVSPGRGQASYVDYVSLDPVAPSAATTRGTADVFHEAIWRSAQGAPGTLTCPEGSTADFHTWRVTRLESRRYTDATGALTGSTSRRVQGTLSLRSPA